MPAGLGTYDPNPPPLTQEELDAYAAEQEAMGGAVPAGGYDYVPAAPAEAAPATGASYVPAEPPPIGMGQTVEAVYGGDPNAASADPAYGYGEPGSESVPYEAPGQYAEYAAPEPGYATTPVGGNDTYYEPSGPGYSVGAGPGAVPQDSYAGVPAEPYRDLGTLSAVPPIGMGQTIDSLYGGDPNAVPEPYGPMAQPRTNPAGVGTQNAIEQLPGGTRYQEDPGLGAPTLDGVGGLWRAVTGDQGSPWQPYVPPGIPNYQEPYFGYEPQSDIRHIGDTLSPAQRGGFLGDPSRGDSLFDPEQNVPPPGMEDQDIILQPTAAARAEEERYNQMMWGRQTPTNMPAGQAALAGAIGNVVSGVTDTNVAANRQAVGTGWDRLAQATENIPAVPEPNLPGGAAIVTRADLANAPLRSRVGDLTAPNAPYHTGDLTAPPPPGPIYPDENYPIGADEQGAGYFDDMPAYRTGDLTPPGEPQSKSPWDQFIENSQDTTLQIPGVGGVDYEPILDAVRNVLPTQDVTGGGGRVFGPDPAEYQPITGVGGRLTSTGTVKPLESAPPAGRMNPITDQNGNVAILPNGGPTNDVVVYNPNTGTLDVVFADGADYQRAGYDVDNGMDVWTYSAEEIENLADAGVIGVPADPDAYQEWLSKIVGRPALIPIEWKGIADGTATPEEAAAAAVKTPAGGGAIAEPETNTTSGSTTGGVIYDNDTPATMDQVRTQTANAAGGTTASGSAPSGGSGREWVDYGNSGRGEYSGGSSYGRGGGGGGGYPSGGGGGFSGDFGGSSGESPFSNPVFDRFVATLAQSNPEWLDKIMTMSRSGSSSSSRRGSSRKRKRSSRSSRGSFPTGKFQGMSGRTGNRS